jgi:hypothetical protein
MLIGNWLVGGVLFAGTEDVLVAKWHQEFLDAAWHGTNGSLADMRGDNLRALPSAADTRDPPRRDVPLLVTRMQAIVKERVFPFLGDAAMAPAVAWWHVTSPVIRLFDPNLSATGLGYLLLRNAWSILVWALAGGIIARIAAFAFTKDRSLGLTAGASDAALRYPAHALAPVLAACAIFVVALPLVLLGLVARLDWIAWATGMVWLIALLFGLMLAVLVVGLVVGWPLLWATIAVEQSDAFDAVSRTYAYVYQRPLHFAVYGLITVALAVIGSVVVHLFLESTTTLADWAVGWGRGAPIHTAPDSSAPLEPSTALSRAAAGRRFWTQLAASAAAAYPLGLLFASAVGVYLLLRLHVDGAQTDELSDDELETLQTLPRLTPHGSGIPDVEVRPVE